MALGLWAFFTPATIHLSKKAFILIPILLNLVQTLYSLRIQATAPVESVKKGGILSLHCQFWDFETNSQNVILSRRTTTSSKNQDLTLNDIITARTSDLEDRVYLAGRQLNDGSYVYFLSITDITREDEGDYSCKVQNSSNYRVIDEQAVSISVKYFPSTNPSCSIDSASESRLSAGERYLFNAGDKIVLNCTSEQTGPRLNLQWSRSGTSNQIFRGSTHDAGRSTTSSLLQVTLGMIDNSKIFVCQVSSPYFPGVPPLSCHVGPFHIIPNKDHKPDITVPDVYEYPNVVSTDYNSLPPVDCLKKCSTSSSTQYYWIMSTAVSGVLALTLCIVAVILVFRYYRLMNGKRQLDLATRHAAIDDIYEKVQCREEGGMVYMSLKKTMKSGNPVMYVQGDNYRSAAHYNVAPSNEPIAYPSQYA